MTITGPGNPAGTQHPPQSTHSACGVTPMTIYRNIRTGQPTTTDSTGALNPSSVHAAAGPIGQHRLDGGTGSLPGRSGGE